MGQNSVNLSGQFIEVSLDSRPRRVNVADASGSPLETPDSRPDQAAQLQAVAASKIRPSSVAVNGTQSREQDPASRLLGVSTVLAPDTFDEDEAELGESENLLGKPRESLHTDNGEEVEGSHKQPWWAWPLLAAAVMAVSSAAVVFNTMSEVPALTLASWRLQLTTVLLLPGCCVQWRRLPPELKGRTRQKAWLLVLSGVCMTLHFAGWVWGLQHTSLMHALLLINITPLLLAAGAWLLRFPISNGELIGTGMGLIGAVLLCLDAVSNRQVTVVGDLVVASAALTAIGYLLAGRNLRSWMPIFIYAFSVTGFGAVVLSSLAIIWDGAGLFRAGREGLFGWMVSKYALRVVYLGVGPGLVGHTGFNTVLRFLPALVVALSLNLEPLVGGLIGRNVIAAVGGTGWGVGVMPAPGLMTVLGGLVLMVSTAAVSWAAHQREQQQKQVAASGVYKRAASFAGPSMNGFRKYTDF